MGWTCSFGSKKQMSTDFARKLSWIAANSNRTHDRIKQMLNATNIEAQCLVPLYYRNTLSSIIDISLR